MYPFFLNLLKMIKNIILKFQLNLEVILKIILIEFTLSKTGRIYKLNILLIIFSIF